MQIIKLNEIRSWIESFSLLFVELKTFDIDFLRCCCCCFHFNSFKLLMPHAIEICGFVFSTVDNKRTFDLNTFRQYWLRLGKNYRCKAILFCCYLNSPTWLKYIAKNVKMLPKTDIIVSIRNCLFGGETYRLWTLNFLDQ